MSFRYRRSIRIAKGVRLNLSKSGIGLSAGGRGFRVGVGPRGAYTSMGIPGTGLYSINYLGKGTGRSRTVGVSGVTSGAGQSIALPPELAGNSASAALGCLWFFGSMILLAAYWPLGVLGIAAQIAWAVKSAHSPTSKAKRHYLQGRNALQRGEWQKALESFLKVLELKPDVTSLYRDIAFLYSKLGQHKEACDYFAKSLEVNPGDIPAKLHYAISLQHIQEYQKTIEVLQSLPLEVRGELPAINALAHAFLGLGRPELALEVLEKGPVRARKKAMDENMKLFRYLLGLVYKELGQVQKALKQFQKIYVEDAGYQNVKDILRELDPSSI